MSSDENAAPGQKPAGSKFGAVSAGYDKEKRYIHTDGINTSVPWRIADYGENGALSDDNLAILSEKLGLSQPVLEALSLYVGNSLDNESLVNITPVKGDVAIKRANEALEKAARLAKRVEHDLARIGTLINPLSDAFVSNDEQRGVLASVKQRTAVAENAATGLHDAIDRVIKLPGSAADMIPADKRRTWDGRRVHVVESCCYAWHDAGRPVTYTSKSDGTADRRGGALVELIQAVVGMVTDPPAKLSSETIRKDIDRWEPEGTLHDEVSMPSRKG